MSDTVALQLRLLLERQVRTLGLELASVIDGLPVGFLLVFMDDGEEGRVGLFAHGAGARRRAARIWLRAGRALKEPPEVRDLGRALAEHVTDETPPGMLSAFLLWLHDLPIFFASTIPVGDVRQILQRWVDVADQAPEGPL